MRHSSGILHSRTSSLVSFIIWITAAWAGRTILIVPLILFTHHEVRILGCLQAWGWIHTLVLALAHSLVHLLLKRLAGILLLRIPLAWLLWHISLLVSLLGPPLRISLLPSLLFLVSSNTFLHIKLKFTALPSWKLVQFEFKDLPVVGINALLHNLDDSFLLIRSDGSDAILQLSFFIHGHGLVRDRRLFDAVNDCLHLVRSWVILSICHVLILFHFFSLLLDSSHVLDRILLFSIHLTHVSSCSWWS